MTQTIQRLKDDIGIWKVDGVTNSVSKDCQGNIQSDANDL